MVVEDLEQESKRLVMADHFDSTNITARQVYMHKVLATIYHNGIEGDILLGLACVYHVLSRVNKIPPCYS